ncbi:hypothetical protein H8C17_002634 [Salmonella enterica]|nr:hypothetical protein [Salmonella enterica]
MKSNKKQHFGDVAVKLFYIILGLFWLPGIAGFIFNTFSMLHDGLSEIPQIILYITISALSILITCFFFLKIKKRDTKLLKYPLGLFIIALFVLPFAQGAKKAIAAPLIEQPQPVNSVNGIDGLSAASLQLDVVAHALLTIVPVLASVAAICVSAVAMYEAIGNKKI